MRSPAATVPATDRNSNAIDVSGSRANAGTRGAVRRILGRAAEHLVGVEEASVGVVVVSVAVAVASPVGVRAAGADARLPRGSV